MFFVTVVTVMFQIVSTLMEEVPAFALRMRELQGESPNIQLKDNPWGHVEHCDANCTCLESDRTGTYVHCLLPLPGTLDSTPPNDNEVSVEVENGFTFNDDCPGSGVYTVCQNGGQLLPGERHRHTQLSVLYGGYAEVNGVTSCLDTVIFYVRIIWCLSDFTSERTQWKRRDLLRRFVHIDRT